MAKNGNGADYDEPLAGETSSLLLSTIKERNRKSKSPISSTLRWVINGLSLLTAFLYSGIIFGWAPMGE